MDTVPQSEPLIVTKRAERLGPSVRFGDVPNQRTAFVVGAVAVAWLAGWYVFRRLKSNLSDRLVRDLNR